MGHERIGVLPRTQRWRDVVQLIADFHKSNISVSQIVRQTLANVRSRFRNIDQDGGVNASFAFLVALSASSRLKDPQNFLSQLGIDIKADITPAVIARALNEWVSKKQESAEYLQIARSAATDAIAEWCEQQKSHQRQLFEAPDDPLEIWRKASNGAGFCEIARLYFARFTERYLKYFLEREASSTLRTFSERDDLNKRVQEHVDKISRFAFETSKITQSFAAGWFNKHAVERVPSEQEIRSFLMVAFGKLRDELWREDDVS